MTPKVPTSEAAPQRRDQRGAQRAQEEEDDHHDEPDGEQELDLDVFDRGADGGGAVGQHGHCAPQAAASR